MTKAFLCSGHKEHVLHSHSTCKGKLRLKRRKEPQLCSGTKSVYSKALNAYFQLGTGILNSEWVALGHTVETGERSCYLSAEATSTSQHPHTSKIAILLSKAVLRTYAHKSCSPDHAEKTPKIYWWMQKSSWGNKTCKKGVSWIYQGQSLSLMGDFHLLRVWLQL